MQALSLCNAIRVQGLLLQGDVPPCKPFLHPASLPPSPTPLPVSLTIWQQSALPVMAHPKPLARHLGHKCYQRSLSLASITRDLHVSPLVRLSVRPSVRPCVRPSAWRWGFDPCEPPPTLPPSTPTPPPHPIMVHPHLLLSRPTVRRRGLQSLVLQLSSEKIAGKTSVTD